MESIIKVKPATLLHMEPMALADFLRSEMELIIPASIDTDKDKKEALEEMNKAAAYICYFREMETLTKTLKRKNKRNGCVPEETDRLLGCEEVFETYKKIAEQTYDYITKMMTMKRLMLDETKLLGTTT